MSTPETRKANADNRKSREKATVAAAQRRDYWREKGKYSGERLRQLRAERGVGQVKRIVRT